MFSFYVCSCVCFFLSFVTQPLALSLGALGWNFFGSLSFRHFTVSLCDINLVGIQKLLRLVGQIPHWLVGS